MPASFIEAAVYTGKRNDVARKRGRKLKKALGRSRRAAAAAGLPGGARSDDGSDGDSDNHGNGGGDDSPHQTRVGFSSFRWGSKGVFSDSPRREYHTDDVGRLKDLVGGKRKVGGEVRLKVECVRPPDSVVTTVSTARDLGVCVCACAGRGGFGGWG